MHSDLKQHIESALNEFSINENMDYLLEAKDQFFGLIGKIQEEDSEYENIMNSFNDWYLFNFLSDKKTKTIMKEYLVNHDINGSLFDAFTSVHFSLFEYMGPKLGGQIALYDYLRNRTIKLAKKHVSLAMLKNDVFLGRVTKYQDEFYMMDGVSLLPREIKYLLKKQVKILRRKKDTHSEKKYLYSLDKLKNKWKNYGHIDPVKFFEMNADKES